MCNEDMDADSKISGLIQRRSDDRLALVAVAAARASLFDFCCDSLSGIPLDFIIDVGADSGPRVTPDVVMVSFRRGGRFAGVGVSEASSREEAFVVVASGLQDAVIEEYAVAIPRCPGHPHPLSARVVTEPMWVCPNDSTHFSCRIGEYGQAIRG